MAAINYTTSTPQLIACKCKCPSLPLGGDISLSRSFLPTVPTSFADFQRDIELLELLSVGKCFGNHNAKALLQW